MFTKISQISQENTGVGDFFNKVASLLVSLSNKVKDFLACNVIKKRLQHRCFPVKFEKCLRTPTFKNLYAQLLLNIKILQQICIVFIFGSITIVCVYIYILYIYIYIYMKTKYSWFWFYLFRWTNLLGKQFFWLLKFQCIYLAVTSSTYLNYSMSYFCWNSLFNIINFFWKESTRN